MKFKAFRVKEEGGKYLSYIDEFSFSDLPQGELLIKVSYSTINYKDALSFSGNKGVTKNYPHTPGVDSVGEIVDSKDNNFRKGDKVLVCGYDFGMNVWGAYSQYISVPSKWAIKLPKKLSEKDSMKWGTAGHTAVMSIYELLNCNANVPLGGNIVVSGATGGVGIISSLLLVKLGYRVTVITSKVEKKDFFIKNGISEVLTREEFLENSNKPLLKEIYDGGIDVTGGQILDSMLKKIKYKGAVTCCGLVNSTNLHTNVFPFILRGIRLIGIDSVECTLEYKEKMWNLLSDEWNLELPSEIITEINMEDLPKSLEKILKGDAFGRILVKIS